MLELTIQIETLNKILMVLSRKSEQVSLDKKLNGPLSFKICPTNNITGENITLIYESATGLFSHEVDI